MSPTIRPPSRFDIVAAQLDRFGVTVEQLPAEYRVRLRGASPRGNYVTEDLRDALISGRMIAAREVARELTARRAIGSKRRQRRRSGQRRKRWLDPQQKRVRWRGPRNR
jgi:hypothetical protein